MKISEQICEMLTKASIPSHKQRQHVARILNISYPSARRLLIGETQWTDQEITAVLESLGLKWDGLSISTKDLCQAVATLKESLPSNCSDCRAHQASASSEDFDDGDGEVERPDKPRC